ncbi:MAG: RNA methyltransferase [Methanobacteriota archaeon]|nr:MAG: RNA methyltransferase [Euryarchaeota archaeon]
MRELIIVLVAPKNEGNVGAVARAMKNFGAHRLVLVDPCPIGDEARRRAMQGGEVLERAVTAASLDDALRRADLVAGTTGIATASEKKFLRIAVDPREFGERVAAADGTVAILFGREDFGLLDEELARCDLLVSIPANPEYPILNLSHAVAIVLYELFAAGRSKGRLRRASGPEKEVLHRTFGELMEATDYAPHKRARTKIMFRRLVGRAAPSKWEFHALMGVLQRAVKRIRRLERDR